MVPPLGMLVAKSELPLVGTVVVPHVAGPPGGGIYLEGSRLPPVCDEVVVVDIGPGLAVERLFICWGAGDNYGVVLVARISGIGD